MVVALLVLLGALLGFVNGLWWGHSQGWLLGIPASFGGALVGGVAAGVGGCILDETPKWIDRFSKTHRLLGGIFFWLFLLLALFALGALWYAEFSFVRHMSHHH